MSVDHYENASIASYWLPRRIRPAVVAIYRLARYADALAVEENHSPENRLTALNTLDHAVHCAEHNQDIPDPHVKAVAPFMQKYHLAWSLWHSIFSAFKQDVTVHRYISHAHLLNYCSRSANPMGRLLMPIYDLPNSHTQHADALCTALQLIHFWQDIAIDEAKGRRYLPDDDLIRAGLSLDLPLGDYVHHPSWLPLIEQQLERAESLLFESVPLLGVAQGRIRWKLALTAAGGARIIQKIRTVRGNIFAFRPSLGLADTPILLYDAIQWIRRGSQAHDTTH